MRIGDYQDNINILTITNVIWASKTDHNLWSIIILAKKCIKMFLNRAGPLSKIIVDEKVFGLANMIKNQYIILLTKIFKSITINQVAALIMKTWFVWIAYLGFRSLL